MEGARFAAKISPITVIDVLSLNTTKRKWGDVEIEHL
jgi:hypothetical protein